MMTLVWNLYNINTHYYAFHTYYIPEGATVELVTGSSSATEGHIVSFCAVVRTNGIGCAVGFDFSISLSFRGSAGIVFNLLCYILL